MKRFKKRGIVGSYIVPLILGVLVLSMALFFIFEEFFAGDDADWETCRQSIYLRHNLPELKKLGITFHSFKNDYPLKCKTSLVEIGIEDVLADKANAIIAETLVQCWALYGNGDMNPFPADTIGKNSYCVPCARIHLTEEAKDTIRKNKALREEAIKKNQGLIKRKIKEERKEELKKELKKELKEIGDLRINIKKGLSKSPKGSRTYILELNMNGEQFPAFNFASGVPYTYGPNFDIDYENHVTVPFWNRKTGITADPWHFLGLAKSGFYTSRIQVPEYFNPDQGDIIINYGTVTSVTDIGIGNHIPYLFYFQIDQKPDPFLETKTVLFDPDLDVIDYVGITAIGTPTIKSELLVELASSGKIKRELSNNNAVNFCEHWEGIPG